MNFQMNSRLAVLMVVALAGLGSAFNSYHSSGAMAQVSRSGILNKLVGKTILFRRLSTRDLQIEYFSKNGRGAIWSASLGKHVIPVRWSASRNLRTGVSEFCYTFRVSDLPPKQKRKFAAKFSGNTAIRTCQEFGKISRNIVDSKKGDYLGLMSLRARKKRMPSRIRKLEQVKNS